MRISGQCYAINICRISKDSAYLFSNSVDGFSGRCAMGMKDDDEFVVVDTKKKGQREESRRSARQECRDND